MGQTLTNGLYLPDEGERYCYDGLASNWTILDAVVGGYNAHIGNTTIHITSEERIKWNTGVTQAYVLRYASSSVSANSTVAYSSLDNTDNVKIDDKVLDQDGKLYSVTAVDSANSQITVGALLIDLSKDSDLSNYYTKAEVDALDSNAVHKAGNETITGNKLFEGASNLLASNIVVSSDSTYVIGIKDQKLVDKNLFNILNKRITYNNSRNTRYTWTIYNKNNNGNTISSGVQLALSVDGQAYFYPINDNDIFFGALTSYIKGVFTKKINNLTPSSLSMPNIANKIDISGYITDLAGGLNTYTPPDNGWICIQTDNSSVNNYIRCDYDVIRVESNGNGQASGLSCLIPVITNTQVNIRVVCTTLSSAYFIPCQGNI